MIKSFKDKETEKIFNQQKSKKLPVEIQFRALKKLIILDNAVTERDLNAPPSNCFEHLKDARKGECSIRINDQWRLCFRFEEGNAYDVAIEDYHSEGEMKKRKDRLPTPTVGEILREEFIEPLGITAYRLAKDIGVSTTTILEILNGKRKITVETALRMAKYFGNSERFWLNLQNDIDLRNRKEKIGRELKDIQPLKISA